MIGRLHSQQAEDFINTSILKYDGDIGVAFTFTGNKRQSKEELETALDFLIKDNGKEDLFYKTVVLEYPENYEFLLEFIYKLLGKGCKDIIFMVDWTDTENFSKYESDISRDIKNMFGMNLAPSRIHILFSPLIDRERFLESILDIERFLEAGEEQQTTQQQSQQQNKVSEQKPQYKLEVSKPNCILSPFQVATASCVPLLQQLFGQMQGQKGFVLIPSGIPEFGDYFGQVFNSKIQNYFALAAGISDYESDGKTKFFNSDGAGANFVVQTSTELFNGAKRQDGTPVPIIALTSKELADYFVKKDPNTYVYYQEGQTNLNHNFIYLHPVINGFPNTGVNTKLFPLLEKLYTDYSNKEYVIKYTEEQKKRIQTQSKKIEEMLTKEEKLMVSMVQMFSLLKDGKITAKHENAQKRKDVAGFIDTVFKNQKEAMRDWADDALGMHYLFAAYDYFKKHKDKDKHKPDEKDGKKQDPDVFKIIFHPQIEELKTLIFS